MFQMVAYLTVQPIAQPHCELTHNDARPFPYPVLDFSLSVPPLSGRVYLIITLSMIWSSCNCIINLVVVRSELVLCCTTVLVSVTYWSVLFRNSNNALGNCMRLKFFFVDTRFFNGWCGWLILNSSLESSGHPNELLFATWLNLTRFECSACAFRSLA